MDLFFIMVTNIFGVTILFLFPDQTSKRVSLAKIWNGHLCSSRWVTCKQTSDKASTAVSIQLKKGRSRSLVHNHYMTVLSQKKFPNLVYMRSFFNDLTSSPYLLRCHLPWNFQYYSVSKISSNFNPEWNIVSFTRRLTG